MHLALIGCSSAGKTTLAKAIVSVCRDRGISADLSESFAMRRLGLGWVRSPFARRRVLEAVSLVWFLFGWRRHREYLAAAWRAIDDAPGGWKYRLGLMRLTIRKLGMHALVDGAVPPDHVVVSDNEAVLQAAHHLFVHPKQSDVGAPGIASSELVHEFAVRSPRPDLVVYVRLPEAELVQRMLRRGHGRLGPMTRVDATRFVKEAVETFEKLRHSLATEDELLVIEPLAGSLVEEGAAGASAQITTIEPILSAALEAVSRHSRVHEPHDPVGGSALMHTLFSRLNREGVAYCFLHSGHAQVQLSDSEGGSIWVDEAGRPAVARILACLGFKEAREAGRAPSAGSAVHMGLDPSSGSLICLRLATEVAFRTGSRRGYRLPVESLLRNETRMRGIVRVPTDAAALVLFVLRGFIEAGPLGPSREGAGKGRSSTEELRWLARRCSMDEVLRLVDIYCPWIGEALFLECLNTLFDGGSRLRSVALSRRVHDRVRRGGGWVGEASEWAGPWLFVRVDGPRSMRFALPSGGALVAFVGPDATGKSTLAADVAACLRAFLRVEQVHLGKPRSSVWTWGVNSAAKLRRLARGRQPRWKPRPLSEPGSQGAHKVRVTRVLYGIRAVALAFDRRRASFAAFRAARAGAVVLCDRYPNPAVGAMDGPRLEITERSRGVLARPYRMLATLERRLYDGLPTPDVLITLRVSLEEAHRRNQERSKADKHTEAELAERHRLPAVDWSAAEGDTLEIDTGRPLEESRLAARQAVWGAL